MLGGKLVQVAPCSTPGPQRLEKAKAKLWHGSMDEYHNNSVASVPLC